MPTHEHRHERVLVGGIFVGGASSRMGHVPKGLLQAPDGATIVERWVRLFRAVGAEPVLVGRHPAYAAVGVPCLADATTATATATGPSTGVGPLGGLIALLRFAAEHHDGGRAAIAVACDMPYVTEELLRTLSTHTSRAPIVAPRIAGKWEPFFARYQPTMVLDVATRRVDQGTTSLQGLLDTVPAEPWTLTPSEILQLRDWDRPSDLGSAE